MRLPTIRSCNWRNHISVGPPYCCSLFGIESGWTSLWLCLHGQNLPSFVEMEDHRSNLAMTINLIEI